MNQAYRTTSNEPIEWQRVDADDVIPDGHALSTVPEVREDADELTRLREELSRALGGGR